MDIVKNFCGKINRCGYILDAKIFLNMCKEKSER